MTIDDRPGEWAEETEEVARNNEDEALKKREAEKKQFKKGQADLEKELGF